MSISNLKNLNVNIQEQVALAPFTTFQIGGPCPGLINCEKPDQVKQVIATLREENTPFLFIGSGSNLLVSDEGIDRFVVRYVSDTPQITLDSAQIMVTASTLLDDLALFAAEKGLAGLNYCSGIPGTVGGAVVGNAGAFGKQISDSLVSVTVLDKDSNPHDIAKEDLGFEYRDSVLKQTHDIVLSMKFLLTQDNAEALLTERQEILNLRHVKHPDYKQHPCAGSFFRNIEKTSDAGRRQAAGWFLDKVGAKALKVGGAGVYEKHANIIINENKASAKDVLALSRQMAELVKQEFDLDLIREVLCVGDIEGVATDSAAPIIW